jgi:hypothetical protein
MQLAPRSARRISTLANAAVALLGLAPSFATAVAQPSTRATDRRETAATTFAVGNVEFLLLHEIAHFLIDEKELPIIGPEENAADYIATLALLREESLDPARASRGREFLLSAADAFAAAWRTGQALGADVPYWSAHALSIQRYYQIACLLYGSDPVAFASVPRIAGLPGERAESCTAEYARADRSIQWLLDNYGRRPGDPPGSPTDILYENPPTRVSERVLEQLRSLELLERTVERLHERFTITRPSRLVLRSCGAPEAAWVDANRELVICYELLDTLYLLGLGDSGGQSHLSPSD